VGRKDHYAAFWGLVHFIDKDGPSGFQGLDDVFVVNDLLADVDGSAIVVERLLDSNHGAVNSRAIASGGG
jgi:hypothetical protein